MSLVLALGLEEKIKDDDLKTPLYTIDNRHITVIGKEGKKVINLNEISNVRLQKKRNFVINIFLFLFTLLVYSITSDYFDRNFIYHIILIVFTAVSSVVSLWVEHYTYVLYINTNRNDYVKLRMSKKDLPYALHLAALFKSGYLQKYN